MRTSRGNSFKIKTGLIFGLAVLVLFIAGLAGFFAPREALAVSIQNFGNTLGLGSRDLVDTVISVVQWILGLLGLIAVIIILYGGFVWMTAAGNEEKIKKAKQILTNAVIGLVIILLAWAIVYFVWNIINGGGNPNPSGPNCGQNTCTGNQICCPGNICLLSCGSLPGANFQIAAVEVSRDSSNNVYMCSKVKARFNAAADGARVGEAATQNKLETYELTTQTQFQGSFSPLGDTVTFEHSNLFNQNTDYQELYPNKDELNYPLLDVSNPQRELDSCVLGVGCIPANQDHQIPWPFFVGDQNDTVAPYITTATYPAIPDVLQLTPPGVYPDLNVTRAPIISVIFSEPIYDQTIMAMQGNVMRPTGNFILQRLDGPGGSVVSTYDNNLLVAASVANGFNVYIQDPGLNLLDAFAWYKITVQNVEDLCSNVMDPNPAWWWEFETNDAAPGVVSWSPTGTNECPDVNIYTTFGTSMYNSEVGIVINKQGGGDTRSVTFTNSVSSWQASNYEIAVPGQGTYKVMDVGVPESNYFKTFRFDPEPGWSSNFTYDVNVDTNLLINQGGQTLSKDWTFGVSTADTCTCQPYAWGLSPAAGPKESCVTIQGDCFTGTTANPITPAGPSVKFDTTTAVVGGYASNYITTTIPGNFVLNDRPHAFVTINYQNPSFGTLTSDPPGPEFFVNSNNVSSGPCLWSINPTAGMANWGFHCNGIRFGDPQGSGAVKFSNNVNPGQYASWNDTDVQTIIPAAAVDGNVTVTTPQGTSNGIYFDMQVPPPGTPYFINDNSCDNHPSSPSPWANEQNACLDAIISAKFEPNNPPDNAMDATTYSAANVHVWNCGADPNCVNPTVVGGIFAAIQIEPTRLNDAFEFTPAQPLSTSTYYKVEITQGVTNSSGMGLYAPYSWTFHTKSDPGPCPVESVALSPQSATIGYSGTQAFHSTPQGPNCQSLNGLNYDWNWASTLTDVADVGNIQQTPAGNGPNADGIASNILDGTTQIQATAENHTGQSNLTVDLTYCQSNPNICNQQCAGSQCVNDHCTPVITGLSPASGPIGQYVSVNGCMFSSYNSSISKVQFLGPPVIDAKWPEACGPAGSTWSNTAIIVETPEDETANTNDDARTGPIKVITPYGSDATNVNPGYNGNFNISGGTAVNLCPLNPSAGPNGIVYTATGEGFGSYINPNSNVWFNGASGPVNAAPYTTWNGSINPNAITDNVPNNAITGGVYVQSQANSSNVVPFTVTCNDNSQCATGCCSNNQCAAYSVCFPPPPGSLCKIPDNQSGNTCTTSPDLFPAPNYINNGMRCISDNGDIYPATPPPPGPQGDDCRACCQPGNVYNNLTCTADKAPCDGATRGLYCGCTTDSECGSPTTLGCGNGDPRCCYGRPTITANSPNGGNICRNTDISVTFSVPMDPASITHTGAATDTFLFKHGNTFVPGTISLSNDNTIVNFHPQADLSANLAYQYQVIGDNNVNNNITEGVASADGVGMNGNSPVYSFTTGPDICQIDEVEMYVGRKYSVTGPIQYDDTNTDIYLCANNNCVDDTNSGLAQNQHRYYAKPMGNGQYLNLNNFNYTWDNLQNAALHMESPIQTVLPIGIETEVSTVGPNGQDNVIAHADGGTTYGSADGLVDATVQVCENPWPNTYPYNYPGSFAGMTEPGNFKLWYCRDSGVSGFNDDLPGISTPIVNLPQNAFGSGEMLREIFFSPCKSGLTGNPATCSSADASEDVIGIRIMTNPQHLSPEAWFNNMFPESAGSGSSKIVDGYQAYQVGRTTYVSAANYVPTPYPPKLYTNIYLISYSDNASPETVNIYNQFVSKWFFNTNVNGNCYGSNSNKQCIVRDTKRITDLGEIANALQNYHSSHNNLYPQLSAGTFLEGLTNSKWPSWNAVFGNELGFAPAVDPFNMFVPLCTAPYNEETCWDEIGKKYYCPNNSPSNGSNSRIYQYKANVAGTAANLFANMEYVGPGTWKNHDSGGGQVNNFCSGYSGSNCACFNYWVDNANNFTGHLPNWAP